MWVQTLLKKETISNVFNMRLFMPLSHVLDSDSLQKGSFMMYKELANCVQENAQMTKQDLKPEGLVAHMRNDHT